MKEETTDKTLWYAGPNSALAFWSPVVDPWFHIERFRSDRPPVEFNLYDILAKERRSVFRGFSAETLRELLDGHIEEAPVTPSFERSMPNQPKTGVREGFIVERVGQPLDYLYFCHPGATMFTSDWAGQPLRGGRSDLSYIEPSDELYDPVYLNGLYCHKCRHLGTLRSVQLAGLLEFSLKWLGLRDHFLPVGALSLQNGMWLSNLLVANSSKLFRVKVSILERLLDPKTEFYSTGKQTQAGCPIDGRGTLVLRCVRELALRLAETHQARYFSSCDQEHLILARHLLDYVASTKLDVIEGNSYRIEFYSGLSQRSVDEALVKLVRMGANYKIGNARYRLAIESLGKIVREWSTSTSLPGNAPQS